MRKHHSPGCPCCTHFPLDCGPCPLPANDLILTIFDGVGYGGSGHNGAYAPPGTSSIDVPLTFYPATGGHGPFWDTGCIELPVYFLQQYPGCNSPDLDGPCYYLGDGEGGTGPAIRHFHITFGCAGGSWAGNYLWYSVSNEIGVIVDDPEGCAEIVPGDPILDEPIGVGIAVICVASCDPLKVYVTTGLPLGGVISETGGGGPELPDISVDVCVLVTAPGCGVPGTPILGASVFVRQIGSDPLYEVECTTDADGVCCATVNRGGRYRVRVVNDGCLVDAEIRVSECEGTVEVPMFLCCAHACIDVSGLYADGETTTILEGATVAATDVGVSAVTDVNGRACIALTTEQMLALPSVSGTGCATRRARILVTSSGGWLSRCFDIDIPCGRTALEAAADPEAIFLNSVYLPPVPPAEPVARYTPDLSETCPDLGCEVEGWQDRGLLAINELFQVDYFRYRYLDEWGNPAWYDVLPAALMSSLRTLSLDYERNVGDTPTTYSPFDETQPAQRVEYSASYTGNWTARGETTVFSNGGHIWLCADGAIISLERPGTDIGADPPPNELNVPNTLPEGSDLAAANVIYLFLPFTFDPCSFSGSDHTESIPDALGTDHDLQWSAQWTES